MLGKYAKGFFECLQPFIKRGGLGLFEYGVYVFVSIIIVTNTAI